MRKLATMAVLGAALVLVLLRARTSKPRTVRPIETFVPTPLVQASGFTFTPASQPFPNPVSVAAWHDRQVLVCNYASLFLVDLNDGQVQIIPPPHEVERWCPTGLATRPQENLVYLANYTGKDVWTFSLEGRRLRTVRRLQDSEMISPENLALSPDGKLLAAADYDSHRILLFDETGRKLWAQSVPQAHAVDFGPDGLMASSLMHRELFAFDLAGKLRARHGAMGWGEGKYLWPTLVRRRGDGWIVSDAHTGRLTLLDNRLHVVRQIGGNGPAANLFNMPYAAEPYGDDVLVCDTFHHRLLRLDRDLRCVQVLGTDAPEPWDNGLPPGPSLKQGYWELSARVEVCLPGLASAEWHRGYGAFLAVSGSRKTQLVYPTAPSLFAPFAFPYFCWSGHVEHQGKAYLLLGSYQKALIVLDERGRGVAVPTDTQPWLVQGGLVDSFGRPMNATPLLDKARARFAEHDRRLLEGGDPEEIVRQTYWPEISPVEFQQKLAAAFSTPEGAAFRQRWTGAASDRQAAAREYLKAAGRASLVHLDEYLLARLLAPEGP